MNKGTTKIISASSSYLTIKWELKGHNLITAMRRKPINKGFEFFNMCEDMAIQANVNSNEITTILPELCPYIVEGQYQKCNTQNRDLRTGRFVNWLVVNGRGQIACEKLSEGAESQRPKTKAAKTVGTSRLTLSKAQAVVFGAKDLLDRSNPRTTQERDKNNTRTRQKRDSRETKEVWLGNMSRKPGYGG